MTPYYNQDGVSIYHGDCREVLPELEAGSVHCCVTSPPYWGLRDYGVGDQIGLESSIDEYVATMVEVFREVRRVLRDDGTLWLNLGTSYASGGMTPSQSPLLRRVPSCGNGDTESPGSQDAGRVCPDSYGELQDETPIRHGRNARIDRCASPDGPQTSPTGHGSGLVDSDPLPPDASPRGAQASTTQQSSDLPPDVSGHGETVSACQSEQPTSPPGVSSSADSSACTSGTSQPIETLVLRTEGKESFYTACQKPGCKGVGKCGLCWCSLSIPSLNVKAKDELNTPHLVALALQADGWVLRQTIIWGKNNPMPESVTDRCTKAHEYLFLLTKSARYYFDADAIREPHTEPWRSGTDENRKMAKGTDGYAATFGGWDYDKRLYNPAGRNRRSVWSIPTQPYAAAHFATFPQKLIEPCIKAGTSEEGCCPECGAPWERVTTEATGGTKGKAWLDHSRDAVAGNAKTGSSKGYVAGTTTGWRQGCECPEHKPIPCTVCDPFLGSGTSAYVARQMACKCVGIELNEDYLKLVTKRLEQRVLFA